MAVRPSLLQVREAPGGFFRGRWPVPTQGHVARFGTRDAVAATLWPGNPRASRPGASPQASLGRRRSTGIGFGQPSATSSLVQQRLLSHVSQRSGSACLPRTCRVPLGRRGGAVGIRQPWRSPRQDPSALRLTVTVSWHGLIPLWPHSTWGSRSEVLPIHAVSGEQVGRSGFARGKQLEGLTVL